MGVVPIVNENDTIAVSEIKFGDNDTLSAITAAMVHADYLFLMTDVDCLYDKNPRLNPDAKPVEVVEDISSLTVDGLLALTERKLADLSSFELRIQARHGRNEHEDRGSSPGCLGGGHDGHHKILYPREYCVHRQPRRVDQASSIDGPLTVAVRIIVACTGP